MLAKDADLTKLRFPLLVTDKYDGIRCLKKDGKALTRSFKPVPNDHIRKHIEDAIFDGADGEILVRGRTFNELSGDVRRTDGRPDFYYVMFDFVKDGDISEPYQKRIERMKKLAVPAFCELAIPTLVNNMDELRAYEAEAIARGAEGVMVRDPNGPYKCGRSSVNEGYLLKVKQFADEEAEVVRAEEMMHNDNVANKDAFGRTERSSHKENLRPAGVLGKLVCVCKGSKHYPDGTEFEIGTGYTAEDRAKLWKVRDKLPGKLVKFKHQPSGADSKPRFPVFLGFRDEWDMSS
jgi:DNA ligase 1